LAKKFQSLKNGVALMTKDKSQMLALGMANLFSTNVDSDNYA